MGRTKEQMAEYQRQRRLQKKGVKVEEVKELPPCPLCSAAAEKVKEITEKYGKRGEEIEALKLELAAAQLSGVPSYALGGGDPTLTATGRSVIKNREDAEVAAHTIIKDVTYLRVEHLPLCPCMMCQSKRGELKEGK